MLFGGLFATAMNNVLLARANKRLGPLVANLYVPLQPLCTATLDYIFLKDAFYLSNLLCGIGVVAGLLLVKVRIYDKKGLLARFVVSNTPSNRSRSSQFGKVRELHEISAEHAATTLNEHEEMLDSPRICTPTGSTSLRKLGFASMGEGAQKFEDAHLLGMERSHSVTPLALA